MSKQTPRQPSKQGQSANKQSNNQSSKQNSPMNKQTANVSVKQERPQNKQTINASSKQTNPANKPLTRQAARQVRRQQQQTNLLDAQRRTRRRRILLVSLVVAALVLAAGISVLVYVNAHNATAQNPNAFPTEQVFNSAYPPVDGIYCDQLEQTSYHIHAHLTIYINGQPVTVPQSVGIASDQSCLYWLHTHANNGVIHIEAPKQVSPTLGNFLDLWGLKFQQLGFHNELALSAGWTVYVNGKQVTSKFNQLVLQPHMVITIAYNSPNITPDTSYNWSAGE